MFHFFISFCIAPVLKFLRMKHKAEQILSYIESLPQDKQDILLEKNMNVLRSFCVGSGNHVTKFVFPNGYGMTSWAEFDGSHTYCVYGMEGNDMEQVDNLMQVQVWIAAWEVMNRAPYVEPNISEKLIAEIRAKCNNPDDLAKIVSAIEVMREELIEVQTGR
jgi:hypothetical protein